MTPAAHDSGVADVALCARDESYINHKVYAVAQRARIILFTCVRKSYVVRRFITVTYTYMRIQKPRDLSARPVAGGGGRGPKYLFSFHCRNASVENEFPFERHSGGVVVGGGGGGTHEDRVVRQASEDKKKTRGKCITLLCT